MATTTKGGDFLGRALVNENPGASTAKDFLGRGTIASDKDFLGRGLVNDALYPPANVARNTAYTLGQTRRVPGIKEVQTLTATGTPTGPLKIDVTLRGETRKTAGIGTVNQANIQSAIAALPNVEPGDVTVGGSGPWTLTFEDEFGDVALAVADNADVTGGSYAITQTTAGNARGEILTVKTAGTSHASNAITPPAVGADVTDGTVVWTRLK